MKIVYLKNLSPKQREKLINRSESVQNKTVQSTVSKILTDVKKDGDVAIKKYVKQFNQADLSSLLIEEKEIKDAYKFVDKELILALTKVAKNIKTVCVSQLNQIINQDFIATEPEILVGRIWRPIEKIGLYIPGGKAIYPSTVLMTGIPAILAGCKEIILCSPPNSKRSIPPVILVAADLVGIKKIFKVGGAEAIGAMAYGTKSIPKVNKIFGPGNSFVNEAKIQVSNETAIDLPAGPSEVFIIADETANPSFIASDLMADLEHGDDSCGILLTTSKKLAIKVNQEISKQIKTMSTGDRIRKSLKQNGLIGIVDSLDEAVIFCNEYAPEHLEIQTENPDLLVKKIQNAGSILLGTWTSKSAADYATGANHVLPTGGKAKSYGGLSIQDFGKFIEVQKISSRAGLNRIGKTIEILADAENLPAHKNATEIRLQNLIE